MQAQGKCGRQSCAGHASRQRAWVACCIRASPRPLPSTSHASASAGNGCRSFASSRAYLQGLCLRIVAFPALCGVCPTETGDELISLRAALAQLVQSPAVLVSVLNVQGSVPRGAGTCMLVFADSFAATIGGGHLEFQAIAHARRLLAGQAHDLRIRHVLGPSLGQCCGGAVDLGFETVGAADVVRMRQLLSPARVPMALFGGGHVGRAIVNVLAPLPFAVRWIDSRDEIFELQPCRRPGHRHRLPAPYP